MSEEEDGGSLLGCMGVLLVLALCAFCCGLLGTAVHFMFHAWF